MVRARWLLLGVVAVVLLAGGWSLGDDKKTDDKKPDEKKDTPATLRGQLPANYKKLGLSDEQKQKIYKIQGEYRTKILELSEQIKKLTADERAEYMKVLTDAQKARLKELQTGEDSKVADKKPDDKKPDDKKPDDKKPDDKKPDDKKPEEKKP
jgi:hypothetical protein